MLFHVHIDIHQINQKIKNAYQLNAVKLLHVYNFIMTCGILVTNIYFREMLSCILKAHVKVLTKSKYLLRNIKFQSCKK